MVIKMGQSAATFYLLPVFLNIEMIEEHEAKIFPLQTPLCTRLRLLLLCCTISLM